MAIKTAIESPSGRVARYEQVGFCSDNCYNQFWQKVLAYSAEYIIGTDIENFDKKWAEYWNDSIRNAFSGNADIGLIAKINQAAQTHSEQFVAFPWWDSSKTPIWMAQKSSYNAKLALAQNLEKCGRISDSAKVFEELRMYERARELREKKRHILIKKTDISVNLNTLLQQVKDTGVLAVFRCPNCGGKLKIDKGTSVESLRKCEHCGTEIESMDLADFLKTALS